MLELASNTCYTSQDETRMHAHIYGHVQKFYIVAPSACTRGKTIGFVCLFVVVVVTKIARSRVLGICVCCNYHELVDIGEKLVSVCFKLLNMAH